MMLCSIDTIESLTYDNISYLNWQYVYSYLEQACLQHIIDLETSTNF